MKEKRKEKANHILGQTVTVTVDRPLGTCHPQHETIIYPVNYGYVEGVQGGDGEWQDAYILGVDQPVASFTGQVVGVVLRKDDLEDKWVVAPEGRIFDQAEIGVAIHFQERFFDTSLVCLNEKSCGAVVFRRTDSKVEYLLLFQNKSKTWSFPKGHQEMDESEMETALREIQEEAGLNVTVLDGFQETVSYPISEKSTKELVLFLAKAVGETEIREDEIKEHVWVDRDRAIEMLPKVGYTEVLQKAEGIINILA